MIWRCIAESSVEPVSVHDCKLFMRLSTADTAEDALIEGLEKSARMVGENMTKRAFVPHTYQLTFDEFPDGGITLPQAPLSTLSNDVTITYVDSSGANQTLSGTAYSIDDRTEPGYLTPSSDNDWPDTNDQINAVTIQYVAGYPLSGGSPTTPDAIKTWIKMRVASMYENREAIMVDQRAGLVELPRTFVDGLLDPYCIVEV